jgi:hypothetical protein
MKKAIGLFIVTMLVFGAVLVSGCNQAGSGSSVGTVSPDDSIIVRIGETPSMLPDMPAYLVIGAFSDHLAIRAQNKSITNKGEGPLLPEIGTPEYVNNWWTVQATTTEGDTTSVLNFKAKLYDVNDVELDDLATVYLFRKVKFLTTLNVTSPTMTGSMNLGTNSRPLTFKNPLVGTMEIDGAFSITQTISGSTTAISLDIVNVTIESGAQGYADFTVGGNYYVPIAGRMIFGDDYYQFDFSAPAALSATGPYYLLMPSRQVTTEVPPI